MIFRIAEFTVKRERVDAAVVAIQGFVAAVAAEEGTLSYGSYRKPDGVSFVHTMVFSDEDGELAHRGSEHARAFHAALGPLCVAHGEPRFTTLEEIATSR